MHRVLYLIVRAESVEDAVETATSRFEEDFVEAEQYTFDYCKPMHPGNSVSGAGRWTAFRDEPNAAPLTDEIADEWLAQGLEDTKRHFAENFYGMFQYMLECLEGSVETAPDAIDQMYAFIKENRHEVGWPDGAEELQEEWPRTITALFEEPNGSMHRHFAGNMRTDNPLQGHIVDYYTYGHKTIVDGGHHLENLAELRETQPEDAWVVPLDVHF